MTRSVSVLLAEDEAPQRDALKALITSSWPSAHVVAECATGVEALEALEATPPDVAFLDIQMPGKSGLEVARACSGKTHVVFVTAHDEYALRAFEQDAVDYLLKPVEPTRFQETLRRLERRLPALPPDLAHVVERLRENLLGGARKPTLKYVTASYGDTVRLYSIDEVVAFQARDKVTVVLLAQGGDAVIRKSLRELQAELDPDEFWQVHRSVIARVSAIASITRDELGKSWLTLKGNPERLPVSSAYQGRFRGM